jgi:hypothetical protein
MFSSKYCESFIFNHAKYIYFIFSKKHILFDGIEVIMKKIWAEFEYLKTQYEIFIIE